MEQRSSAGALDELARDPQSRKRFLRMVGAGGVAALGVLLAACGDDDSPSGGSTTPPATSTTGGGDNAGDIKIVNYALTLEYLEAGFYKQAVDSGELKGTALEFAKSVGKAEQEHVDALKAAVKQLGGKPVEAPATKFEDVIAAGQEKILATAATVENLGAAAYLGQAGAIKSKEILAAALAIHSVEARHAAALNKIIGAGFQGDGPLNGSVPDGAFAKPMAMDEVLKAVKPFLA